MAEPKPYYPPAIIPDGYTRTVRIDGKEGIHPPLEFTYRAMRGLEGGDVAALTISKDEKDQQTLAHRIAERIEQWDLGVPVSVESIRSMQGALCEKVMYIVLGKMKPDEEVLAGETVDNPPSDAELAADAAGN